MAAVAEGIYLEDNPPARSQFRVGRRAEPRSVIVVHTAESGTDTAGPDGKAEAVASFIRGRSDPGSYHLLGDSDSIIQLVRFDDEAWHDRTGSNRWAVGISLAMNAGDWPKLSQARRGQFLDTAAQMSVIAARWMVDRGTPVPEARLLSKAESDRADAAGFISHARRDPGRREDPGAGFPWPEFFARYSAQLGQDAADGGQPVSDIDGAVEDLQRLLLSWGADLGNTGPGRDGVDRDPGLKTIRSATLLLRHLIGRAHEAETQVRQQEITIGDLSQRIAGLQEANGQQAALIDQLRATALPAEVIRDLQEQGQLLAQLRATLGRVMQG